MPKQIRPYAAAGSSDAGTDTPMQAILEHWRRWLGDSRALAAVSLLAALVAAAIVLILWTSGGQMVPLYGSQEQYDTAAIVAILEEEQVNFEIDSRTGTVLVNKDKIASARMKLAAGGVTAKQPAGMESLNDLSSLSTSQFMESNRYTFAIEGELARSILTLHKVRNARVHLAVPKRTMFVGREEQKPTASVILDLTQGLEEGQVEAIVNMVAASVPGLKPAAVSVMDQNGKLLSSGMGENAPGKARDKQMDYVLRLEEKVARTASEMLEPMLGAENFRIRISADVDFSKVEETRETLGNEPVLLSETTMSDSAPSQGAMGIPGALTNRPPVAAAAPADVPGDPGVGAANANADAGTSRREETNRRFGTGKSITHTKNEEARVRKLSISILVNDAAAASGAWAQADLDKISDIVRAAAGIDAARGDAITVQSAPFVARAAPEPPALLVPFWQDLGYWAGYIRYIVGVALFVMLIMFGIRPLVKYLVNAEGRKTMLPLAVEQTEESKFATAAAVREDTPEVVLTGHQPAPAIGATSRPARGALTLPPPGSELEVQLEHLRLLADKETTRVAEVIKSWVHENRKAS